MLLYWMYFNFFFNAQIGIRHVLPVFVLGIIFCGRFLAKPESKFRNYVAVVLVLWVGASTLSYYPHFISYFNEFVLDRKLAYRHLADSNLDWRGNEWYLTSVSPPPSRDYRRSSQAGSRSDCCACQCPCGSQSGSSRVRMVKRPFCSCGPYRILVFGLRRPKGNAPASQRLQKSKRTASA